MYRNYRWLAAEILSIAVLDYKKTYNDYTAGVVSYEDLLKEKADLINPTLDLFAEIILDCDMETLLNASEHYTALRKLRTKYR